MREGSAKLLAACNDPKMVGTIRNPPNIHNTQVLEAAKNLLTSNERMTAYMSELQRRKRDRNDTITEQKLNADKANAKVSISEFRMPLIWRESDYFKNKNDHKRFAVFCLLKIGHEICDTSMLCPVDRKCTDLTFSDVILL